LNKHIVINHRFCGPPDSGNGGYVCGLMSGFIDGVAEVTLLLPPFLDQPLQVAHASAFRFFLTDVVAILAEARSTHLDLDVPAPPNYKQAKEASRRYRGFDFHPAHTCFVCGPERAKGDGLRIFAGPVAGKQMVAANWVPDEWLADEQGYVKPEFLWAALDCPGCFAAIADQDRMILLGRLAAKIEGNVKPGEHCVVIGWKISRNGRKYCVGTALFSESGKLCGQAKATWIQI